MRMQSYKTAKLLAHLFLVCPIFLRRIVIATIEEKECTIYMGPSSIRGYNGYGVYTTRDIAENESVLDVDGPSIPVIDFHTCGGGHDNKYCNQWINLFNGYWWGRGVPDHVHYESNIVVDYQITFGSLPNHHCILDSIDNRNPSIPYDDSLLSRFDNPGAGSISYSMGRQFFVLRDVKAGEELFLNYANCEHEENEQEWSKNFPMPEDYHIAADIIMDGWTKSLSQKDGTKNENGNNIEESRPNITLTPPKGTLPRVLSILPRKKDELYNIMSSIETKVELIMKLASDVVSIPQTTEWIKENGMCVETLVGRKSQIIPEAGQGAIAQHSIKKGDIVVPAPTLHILDKKVLTIYDESTGNKKGTQLLINYCLGHPDSTLLLCPFTNAILINHCSRRTKECGKDGPNAKFQWSSGWDRTSDVWVKEKSFDYISEKDGRGLSMEVVALRDIQPGDEVFVDYGIEWEKAWEEHVSWWHNTTIPSPYMSSGRNGKSKEWITAKQANENLEGPILEEFLTNDLLSDEAGVDHPYLFTGCQYWPSQDDFHPVYQMEEEDDDYIDLSRMTDEEIMDDYSDDASSFRSDPYKTHEDMSHWPCSVIRPYDEEDNTYVVRIHQSPEHPRQLWDINNLPRILYNYPRQSIHYFVKPYESDQHLSYAFRHPIGISDDIFPNRWKNLKR